MNPKYTTYALCSSMLLFSGCITQRDWEDLVKARKIFREEMDRYKKEKQERLNQDYSGRETNKISDIEKNLEPEIK